MMCKRVKEQEREIRRLKEENEFLEISKRLGHKTVQTTWDTYTHLYPDKDIALAAAIESFSKKMGAMNKVLQRNLPKIVGGYSPSELAKIFTKLLSGEK